MILLKENFAKRLKELRMEAKLSENELAKILGVTAQTLKSWENGKTVARLCKAVAICNYFKISFNYLIGLTDNKKIKK